MREKGKEKEELMWQHLVAFIYLPFTSTCVCVCVRACMCVREKACEREDRGGKGWVAQVARSVPVSLTVYCR